MEKQRLNFIMKESIANKFFYDKLESTFRNYITSKN